MPNGIDTDIDNSDFSKGIASLGSSNPTGVYWDGSSSTDWTNTSNWALGNLPTSSDDVVVPNGLTSYPTISSATTVNSITINSGASLKADATVTGPVTYKRTLTDNWHLVSSPVNGEDY